MPTQDKFVFRKIFIDLFILGIVVITNKLIREYAPTFQRGFFCNDDTLRYPFESSTVSSTVMYCISSLVPITFILITEYFSPKNKKRNRNPKPLAGCNIPVYLWECYKVIGVFLFGAACSHITTDFTKHVVGRLRPHFIDVCRPDINCTLSENQHRYIEQFECLGTDSHKLKEMRLSFMSGHSSFSAYCMIFLAIYVHARWTWRGSKLLRHFVQLAAFGFMWYTALSRLSDNKHHWSDLVVGLLQGTTVAVLTVLYVSELFPKYQRNSKAGSNNTLPMVQKDVSAESSDN